MYLRLKNPPFQNETKCKPFLWKWVYLHVDLPKTANILQHYQLFYHKMSEERAQKFYTDHVSLPRSG